MTEDEHAKFIAQLNLALADAGGKLESAASFLGIDQSQLYRYLHDGVRPQRKTLERMRPRLVELQRRIAAAAVVARQLGPACDMEVLDDDFS